MEAAISVFALDFLVVVFLVLAALTAVVLGLAEVGFLMAVFLVVATATFTTGIVSIFAAPGVGVVVHSQPPLSSAQAKPSAALSYTSVSLITEPLGSISLACPPVFASRSPVSVTINA